MSNLSPLPCLIFEEVTPLEKVLKVPVVSNKSEGIQAQRFMYFYSKIYPPP